LAVSDHSSDKFAGRITYVECRYVEEIAVSGGAGVRQELKRGIVIGGMNP
jgi:hypothetical protein